MKVWDRAGIKLATPGSAVRWAYVVRHITNCALRPGPNVLVKYRLYNGRNRVETISHYIRYSY